MARHPRLDDPRVHRMAANLAWRRPKRRAATEAYLEAEDSLALWLRECCESGGVFDWMGSTELFQSWKQWAEAAGENPGSLKSLIESLQARGFEPKRKAGDRGFAGG